MLCAALGPSRAPIRRRTTVTPRRTLLPPCGLRASCTPTARRQARVPELSPAPRESAWDRTFPCGAPPLSSRLLLLPSNSGLVRWRQRKRTHDARVKPSLVQNRCSCDTTLGVASKRFPHLGPDPGLGVVLRRHGARR